MVDQKVSEDSKLGQLFPYIWRTNKKEGRIFPEHRLRLFPVRGSNRSFQLLYLPHPSQSNNLSKSPISTFSCSNLSYTASPPSQFLVIVTIGALTVHPFRFNVVKREKLGKNFPLVQ